MPVAIAIDGLTKSFKTRKALEDVSFQINDGELVALIGASGSGKSTLLRHIAGFISADKETKSRIAVHGQVVQQNGRLLGDVRKIRAEVGFIFQQFNLTGRLPLITNVLAGMLFRIPIYRSLLRWFTGREVAEGMKALAQVGMAEYAWQRTSTLSGGQQQRAAIARSLVQNAKVILADEPIASLDPEAACNVMDILTRINRDQGRTVLVSLHQVEMALRYCSRVIAMQKGHIVYDGPALALTPELLRDLYGHAGVDLLDREFNPGTPAQVLPLNPQTARVMG